MKNMVLVPLLNYFCVFDVVSRPEFKESRQYCIRSWNISK